MYVGILNNELLFPEDNVLDRDTRSFIRGVSSLLIFSKAVGHSKANDFNDCHQLLCKDPAMRLTEPRKLYPLLHIIKRQ
jgi:hypothetical protein